MTLIVKDPVYQNTIWQRQPADSDSCQQALAAVQEQALAWQQQTADSRDQAISAWQQDIKTGATNICQRLQQSCGLTWMQTEYWLQQVIDHVPANNIKHPWGAVVIINDLLDPEAVKQALDCLAAGQVVVLVATPPLAAVLELLAASIPETIPLAFRASPNLDISWLNCDAITALYCFAEANTASLVHAQLAGHFRLQDHYVVPQTHHMILSEEVTASNMPIEQIIAATFCLGGQSIYAVKRLVLWHNQATEQIIAAVTQAIKSLRVAAYDANPSPDLASVRSTEYGERIFDQFTQLRARPDIKTYLPMRCLLKGTGMLTPGLVEIPLSQVANVPLLLGPLLQLVVIAKQDDLLTLRHQTPDCGQLHHIGPQQ